MKHKFFLGRESGIVNDLKQYLDEDIDNEFDFIVTTLFHPKFKRDVLGVSSSRDGLITRPDTIFENSIWRNEIVGRISEWIRLDSEDDHLRKASEIAFKEEIDYATHLGVPAAILPELVREYSSERQSIQNYASVLYNTILSNEQLEYWLPIRLDDCSEELGKEDPNNYTVQWKAWNQLRLMCNSHSSLKLSLVLTSHLPSSEFSALLHGEPLGALFISTKLFINDEKGYPHLPTEFYPMICSLLHHNIRIVLTGKPRHEKWYSPYIYELNQIDQLSTLPTKYMQYNDHIQIPLQPLMDNLTSSTYETFELDSPKYQQYEKALYRYFSTNGPISLPSVPDRDPQTIYVMVVGAGRGPLVRATIRAAERANKKIHIYVIEKNYNAIITLKNMKVSLNWGDNIEIIHTDMRDYRCPTKADLVVSELLGSFGDNELDPECLQGTYPSIHSQTVYIPQNYTSFLEPILTPVVYNHARELSNFVKEDPLQCTYVVKLFSFASLSSPQPLFTFEHPDFTQDFQRYQRLSFPITTDCTLYGFAGYFECQLYDDVYMSILPETHTDQMYSWFPLYIPIQTPIPLHPQDQLGVSFWRKTNQSKVWYEWCVNAPVPTIIHNSNGKHQWIGL